MAVYLITGASGFIGSMLLTDLLHTDKDLEVIAPVRNVQKMTEQLSGIFKTSDRSGPAKRVRLLPTDLYHSHFPDQLCAKVDKIDYIIHCACVTKSLEMIQHPVEVTQSIVNATQNVLEAAKRYKIKSMVYLSSMEVYGSIDCSQDCRVTEEEAGCGKMEILNTRSCYPLGKRMAETICYSYFKEYGVPVKIARLAQTFGRGILPSDNRIFAQFARSVRSNTDLVLHTEGRSVGNYCSIDDAVSGILTILERGQNGEAYNVVNEETTMTIRQMAEFVATKIADNRIQVVYDIPKDNCYGYAAETGLRLSGEKLLQLGWRPKKGLLDMYQEMLEDL